MKAAMNDESWRKFTTMGERSVRAHILLFILDNYMSRMLSYYHSEIPTLKVIIFAAQWSLLLTHPMHCFCMKMASSIPCLKSTGGCVSSHDRTLQVCRQRSPEGGKAAVRTSKKQTCVAGWEYTNHAVAIVGWGEDP